MGNAPEGHRVTTVSRGSLVDGGSFLHRELAGTPRGARTADGYPADPSFGAGRRGTERLHPGERSGALRSGSGSAGKSMYFVGTASVNQTSLSVG